MIQARPEPTGGQGIEEPPLLGVEHSVTGRRWAARLTDPRLGLAIAQRLNLPESVGRVLAGRGVLPDQAKAFLDPKLRDSLPDPAHLKDIDLAVARLCRAIEQGESIVLFGDYDVDGATATALFRRFLRAVGVDAGIYIPDRLSEGYGPNAPALLRLRDQGAELVVTLDCGTTAYDALQSGAEAGLDIIVVDHHVAAPRLPAAVAVVNPNRLDQDSDCRHLAAVGVTFLLLVALNRALRDSGWYSDDRPEPDLRLWLDLVALGTVCDVVPLTGVNRAFVTQGLKVMARRGNPGLTALADVAGIDSRPDGYHAGYVLGPRVNAGGRVGQSDLGARLLADDDPAQASRIAAALEGYNAERKQIEADVLDQALAQAEALSSGSPSVVLVVGEGWHPGVIGIVASRLKERFHRPAIVIALDRGVGKGSGRSLPGVDLGAAILSAREAGLLIDGGGHAMAAGLTVAEAGLPALRDFLERHLAAALTQVDSRPRLGLDGVLQPGGATAELMHQLQACGPFGAGNAEPRFAVSAVRIAKASVVGDGHVRCFVQGADGARLKAIAFRALDGPLGQALLQAGSLPLHLAGKLRLDSWVGPNAVQLLIDDAAPVRN